MITRPPTVYDDAKHTYTLNGQKLESVSGIAKVGGALEAFGIASAWGFRIGYEGAYEVAEEQYRTGGFTTKDNLRADLKERGLTPWSKRNKAADRGNWVHDVLEELAQNNFIGNKVVLPPGYDELEVGGHIRALYQWFIDYRPSFVATEVQVTSTEHLFAGRYDIRCLIGHGRLAEYGVDCDEHFPKGLCLVDLKTSKDVYPEQHFPQLAGYELASVEMGFPPTDAQFVLNTKADGTYKFVRSTATADDFLNYLAAYRSIKRLGEKRR